MNRDRLWVRFAQFDTAFLPAFAATSEAAASCTQNSDCTNDPGGPACDVGTGQCVECVLDED
ncbi:MAG: hypothetical protein FJ096_17820, partial [Deltaproteobacteria bacterium]|nr:hypothetical protein [Deltaproteobacteria bacterium]